jgi:hypothetical protein
MGTSKEAAATPAERPDVDARGQISVELDKTRFTLRPDWEALNNAEQLTGRSLHQLAERAAAGGLSMMEMGILVSEFMKAHARADTNAGPSYRGAKPEKVARLIQEAGTVAVTARLAIILVGAITGGYDATGEPIPAA